ncbi:MAG: tail fiber domain-containing protein [bacterium]
MNGSVKSVVAAMIVAAAIVAGAARAHAAISWEITYQGEIKDGGVPMNGTVDLAFKLFTIANVQVGPTVIKDDVVVTNGVFTAQVDFTNGGILGGIFDGNERFIEVTVNGTTLAPRQRLAPAPHAAVSTLLVMPYAERTVVNGPAFFLQNDSQAPNTITMWVQNSSADSGCVAVFGDASAATPLNTVGVLGRSAADNGYGVIGDATSLVGNVSGVYGSVSSPSGNGVFGVANSPTGSTRGVYGKVLSSSGHAGYFDGRGYFSDALGIGTTNPGYALHVSGNGSSILGESNDRISTKLSLKNTDTGGQTWTMRSTGSFDSQGAGKFKIGTVGNENRLCVTNSFVGIGRSTAIGASDFAIESDATGTGYGGMYVNTPSATGRPFYGYATDGDAASWTYYDGITASWRLFHAGAERLAVTGLGNVGIGTTSPAFLLHVDGSAGKPGGGSWSVASDSRLKKNVESLDGALESLLSLRGVTYEYIDAARCNELPGRQVGMIAQEVERVFPDWVETAADGYKRLAFRGFEALTVEALRELAAQQDAQLAAQNEKIGVLETEVAELRTMVQAIAMQSGMNGTVRSAAEWTPAARVAN